MLYFIYKIYLIIEVVKLNKEKEAKKIVNVYIFVKV